LKIKFVGTGSGETSLKRFHSAFIINHRNYSLLVDAGDGIARALLNQNILYNEIDGILFSHFHPDHYCGLPSLIVQMKINRRTKSLTIATHRSRIGFLKEFLKSSLLFEEQLGFEIKFLPFVAENEFKINSDILIIAKNNTHVSKYPELNEDDFSFSFIFKINKKNILYTGDIGGKDDLFLFEDELIDVFITETTHINFEDISPALLSIKPKKTILTHISSEDENEIDALIEKNKNRFSITAAFDGFSETLK
jgi:ribonuclease Z